MIAGSERVRKRRPSPPHRLTRPVVLRREAGYDVGMRRSALFAISLVLFAWASARAEPPARLDSIERLTGGATSPAGLPVIVAIHELGGSPEAFWRHLEKLPARARVVLPRGPTPYGRGASWLPGRDSPRRAAEELRAARRVGAFIRGVIGDSRRRVIVTGFSQGAILSYAVAALFPELVAGAVPLAGYLPDQARPGSAKVNSGVAIRGIHGDRDAVLTVGRARRSVERLRRLGFDVKLHEHPGVGHTITREMVAELNRTLKDLLSR
jgi:phospholipase/carboxylesterase